MSAAPYVGPTTSDLQPDHDMVWAFLSWWFKGCTRGRIEIGWMDPGGTGLTRFRRFDIDDIVSVAHAACVESAIPGQSVYVRASTVNTPDGGNTTDAMFAQSPGIWGDIDTPEQMERARTVQTMVRPNASVITGRIPHLRAQTFFLTETPIEQPAIVRSLNRRIHALYGGDSSVVNPTRLMRLPGTIAWPWKAGRVPELTSFIRPDDGRPTCYAIAILFAQLPQEPESDTHAPGDDGDKRAHLNTARELMRRIKSGKEWHNNVIRLIAHWIGRGWSNSEIQAAAESFTLPGYTAAQTFAEVAKAIEGGRRRWAKPDYEFTVDPEAADKGVSLYDPWNAMVAPEFPIHALPPRLAAFVENRARVIGADVGALAWAAISACSAAVDGESRLLMKRNDNWKVPPAIWVALIGASSSKKTPIIKATWAPLERIQGRALRAWTQHKQRWDALPKKEREDTPEPPQPIRLVTHGATPESLQAILSRQDRGLGVMHDELAGLIEGMDRYSGGKGGGERAFYLQAYNGGEYVIDRIGRGTLSANNLLLTICGGIQPAKLASMSGMSDDGLWQRFVPLIVSGSCMGTDEPGGAAEDDYATMIEDMAARTGGILAQLTEGAHEVRLRVERECFDLEQGEPLGGRFASFCGKLPGLWGRLCLVLAQMEGMPFSVSEKTANMARVLVMQSALVNAGRVAMAQGGDVNSENAQAIAGYILAKKKTRVLASELSRDVWVCRKQSVLVVQQMLSPLVAGGWLTPITPGSGNTGWHVADGVHEVFADRARREVDRRAAARDAIFAGEGE